MINGGETPERPAEVATTRGRGRIEHETGDQKVTTAGQDLSRQCTYGDMPTVDC